jgi:uncharacterized membrane protein HdeD (DUF308 family)
MMRNPPERVDQVAVSMWVAAGLVLAGFVAFALGWRGAAATLDVPVQVPYIVSGGLVGLALIVAGVVLVLVQLGRREAADERELVAGVLTEAHAVLGKLER